MKTLRDFFWRATRHWISAVGAALTTLSAMAFLTLFTVELGGVDLGNYTGILSYLILPAVFLVGLVLIPVGLWRLRKLEAAGKRAAGFPVIDFNLPRVRNLALVVASLTAVNLMVASTATVKGLEVMHQDQFCGGSCHTLMQPEAVAHKATSHANVNCVDCHIGEGVGHFAKAKLRGATQLLQFMVGDVTRPVPQPIVVKNEICVRCHATERYTDDRLHVRRTYSDDEKAVEKVTVFRSLVGGYRDGEWTGAHRHNGLKIRYLSDEKRAVISEVQVTRPDGGTDAFVAKDVPTPAGAQWHEMGCTDCHNRPAHRFFPAKTVVDRAIGRGAIDKELPFIRKEALAALQGTYPSHDAARTGIPAAMRAAYAPKGLEPAAMAKVDAAAALLAQEWAKNNFPDMKVTWGTYVDYFGHEPGCYRCHDKNHANAKGEAVQKKCGATCHDVIATEEEAPEVLDVLYP